MFSKKFEGSNIRKILAYMITNSRVCSHISREWNHGGLFESDWANLVGHMVVEHFKKYGKAPGDSMKSIFEKWTEDTIAGEKEIEAVERFILGVSDELKSMDDDPVEYILDLAADHFNRVKIIECANRIKQEAERGRIEDAYEEIKRHRGVRFGGDEFQIPLENFEQVDAMLDQSRCKPLVRYKGGLGRYIGDSFVRGTLFSFMASDKVGKTTWLIDFTWRALKNRKRVLYFDTGDGSDEEVLRRLSQRVLRRVGSLQAQDQEICTGWNEEDGDDIPVVEKRKFERVDTFSFVHEMKKRMGSPDRFKLCCKASGAISAPDIRSMIQKDHEENDWRPDVVVVDYADLLAPPFGVKDELSQIDETWKMLRRISQEWRCCVVTATQASSQAYKLDKGLLSRRHFGGRKTKLAHVNGMLGINVSPEEKQTCTARINWIVRRSDYFNEKTFCRVGGCYAIQSPCEVSKWW